MDGLLELRYVPPRPLVLQLPGGSVVLSDGAAVTAHQLRRNRDYETAVAAVSGPSVDGSSVVSRGGPAQAGAVSPERREG